MSVRVMSWVWEHSQSVGNDRLVLLAIADHCDHDGMNAWPKIDTLVRKTKLAERTVRRAIKRLAEIGELVVVERGGHQMGDDNPSHRPHLYRVVMGNLTGQDDRSEPAERPVTVTGQNDRATGQNDRSETVSESTSDRSSCPERPVTVTGQVTGHGDRSNKENRPKDVLTVLEPSLTAASASPPTPTSPGPAAVKATVVERGAAKTARTAIAKALVTGWWDERKAAGNPPAQRFPAVVSVVEGVLANGVDQASVAWALRNVPTVSGGAIQMALSRRNGHGRTSTTDTALRMIRERTTR